MRKNGFTLAEMMIVLAIFTVIMGVAYTVLTLNDTYRDLVLIKLQLYRSTKQAVDTFVEEIQKSQSQRVNITDNASSPDEIRFQIPFINATTYNLTWGARLDYPDNYWRHYYLNGTNFTAEVLNNATFSPVSGTQGIKAGNIIDVQFSNSTAGYIGINVTAQKTTLPPAHTINTTLNATVYLRTNEP